jgi:hypothetical protein
VDFIFFYKKENEKNKILDSHSVSAREEEWEGHTLFGGLKYDKQLFPNILDNFEK